MYELDVYEMVFVGCISIISFIVLGLVVSGVLTWCWRWIDRNETQEPDWLKAKLMKVMGMRSTEDEFWFFLFLLSILGMIIAQAIALCIMHFDYTAPVMLAIVVMFLARYGLDNIKLFKSHVKDINAHKEASDE